MPGSPEITTERMAMARILLNSIPKVAGVPCFLPWATPVWATLSGVSKENAFRNQGTPRKSGVNR